MAEFYQEPQPVYNPEYLGWSRPVQQQPGSKAKETLFSSIGKDLELGFKAGDEFEKTYIDNQYRKEAEPIMEEYKATLAQTASDVREQSVLDPNKGTRYLPKDMNQLAPSLSILGDARANNKLSETAYLGRLDSLLKDFRSRYPGYKDYIDQTAERITGVNASNAYIRSLVGDINSFAAAKRDQSNKTEQLLMSHFGDVDDAPALHAALKAGRVTPEYVEQQLYKVLHQEAQWKYNQGALSDYKGSLERNKLITNQVAAQRASDVYRNALETITVAGVGETPQKLVDLMDKQAKGEIKLTDEQWTGYGKLMQSKERQLRDKLNNEFNKDMPGGSICVRLGSPEACNALIDKSAENFHQFSTAITNKDFGLAFTNAEMSKAVGQDALRKVQDNPQIGPTVRLLNAFNHAGGPPFAEVMWRSLLLADVPQMDKAAVMALKMSIMGQPNKTNDPNNPLTYKDAFQTALKAGVTSRESFREILSGIDQIENKKAPDEVKLNNVKALFDANDIGLIKLFELEHRDPATGKVSEGQYSIYSRILSPGIIKEVEKLGAKEPGLVGQMRDWAGSEFASLFQEDIINLNSLKMPGIEPHWHSGDANNPPRIEFRYKAKPTEGALGLTDVKTARDIEARLNQGIAALSRAAATGGPDVETQVLSLFIRMGLDPTNADIKDIPQGMLRALITTREQQRLQEESERKKFK